MRATISFKPTEEGTAVAFVVRDSSALMGELRDGLGWFASHVVAPVLSATEPAALGGWIADRVDRRPGNGGS